MWELDCKKSWALKNWCLWTVVLGKTLESPLDCKEIQPVYPEGDQSWVFIGRTDAEAETPILWPPDAKSWLTRKDLDAGKDWRQEKGTTKDEMVGWHHQLNGHEFGWTPGVGDGQGGLVCCSPWGRKESDTRTELNLVTAKLSQGEFRDFLYFLIHTSMTSPILNIPQQSGTFVTSNEPILTHYCHPKSTVYIRNYSWSCTICGFEQMDNDMYQTLSCHIE